MSAWDALMLPRWERARSSDTERSRRWGPQAFNNKKKKKMKNNDDDNDNYNENKKMKKKKT